MIRFKIYFFSFIIFCLSTIAYGQHGKVVSSWRYLQDYLADRDTSNLNKAREAIDLAIVNQSTFNSAKTYYYAGQIYQCLFEASLEAQLKLHSEIKDVNERSVLAYQLGKIDKIVLASNFYSKALELDVAKDYSNDIIKRLNECSQYIGNVAFAFYQNKIYSQAAKYFYEAGQRRKRLALSDSAEFTNARIAYEQAGDTASTLKMYKLLVENKIGGASLYVNYARFLAQTLKHDEAAFLVVKQGRALFAKDQNLINLELGFYIKGQYSGSRDQAIQDLESLAIAEPPKDISGKNLPNPVNSAELITKSGDHYLKSYSLDSTNSVTQFNLAAFYANRGFELLDKVNPKMGSQDKVLKADGLRLIQKASRYMEIYQLGNPSDCDALQSLKRIYLTLEDKTKCEHVQQMGKALGCN